MKSTENDSLVTFLFKKNCNLIGIFNFSIISAKGLVKWGRQTLIKTQPCQNKMIALIAITSALASCFPQQNDSNFSFTNDIVPLAINSLVPNK